MYKDNLTAFSVQAPTQQISIPIVQAPTQQISIPSQVYTCSGENKTAAHQREPTPQPSPILPSAHHLQYCRHANNRMLTVTAEKYEIPD